MVLRRATNRSSCFVVLLCCRADAAFPEFKRTWSFAVTPLDQLRLRLTDHDFDRLMQAAKPIQVSDRDAFLKDVAAELGQHEVVGPGLLHRVISEVQPRYIATKEPLRAEPRAHIAAVSKVGSIPH